MNPFPRSVLGAAFNAPRILQHLQNLDPQPERDMRHSLLVIILAARIHNTTLAVREAALRMYSVTPEPDREFLLLLVDSRDPLAMVELILQEIEIMSPKQMRDALLIVAEFRKVSDLVGVRGDAPITNVLEKVQELNELAAKAYALEDQVTELQAMLASADKALANAQRVNVDLRYPQNPVIMTAGRGVPAAPIRTSVHETEQQAGARFKREGHDISELWVLADRAGLDFTAVLAGYITAAASTEPV